MTTVGASCEVYLLLRGLVDVSKEVGKLEGEMAGLDATMAKLMEAMNIDNYEERVSAADSVTYTTGGTLPGFMYSRKLFQPLLY